MFAKDNNWAAGLMSIAPPSACESAWEYDIGTGNSKGCGCAASAAAAKAEQEVNEMS